MALGGIAVGVLVTWSITRAKEWIARRYGEESGSQILISLLIPFASYLVAKHPHCSSILAAVSAGVTMSIAEVTGQTLAVTRIRRNTVWDMIQFALNGIIFVLLGEQLSTILTGTVEKVRVTGHHDPGWLIIYVLAINVALAALRFTWVWVSLSLTLFRAIMRGRTMNRPSWRLVAATSLAGARGAITLAGILTLPVALDNGTPFPAIDLAGCGKSRAKEVGTLYVVAEIARANTAYCSPWPPTRLFPHTASHPAERAGDAAGVLAASRRGINRLVLLDVSA